MVEPTARCLRPPGLLRRHPGEDPLLAIAVRRVFNENFGVYGVRKVWRQMMREGFVVARCTVSRLMRETGLKGVVRGKSVRTTLRDASVPCPLDRVNRVLKAPRPNMLWPYGECEHSPAG